jgi:hypothetical protein
LNSDADVTPPRRPTPAFYGCYDWHSSVHGRWLRVRLVRSFPDAVFAPFAREGLCQSLTADNIVQEAAYSGTTDAPVLNGPLDWHGCFNWLLSYGNGSTTRLGRWPRIVSPDPCNPKWRTLDGLNLNRAWMLEGIAAGLPKGDKRLPMIKAAAEEHKRAVTGKHYEGGDWLGSFAVYLITKRGILKK